MEFIGQYLLKLTAAALICGMITAFFGKKGTFGAVIQLLAGMFLTLSILSPWVQLRLDELSGWTAGMSAGAEALGQTGQNTAREAMVKRITEKTAAYILDKASALDADLAVEVLLDDSAIPVPCGVRIQGNVSPYAKKVLSNLLETELGIAPEEQIWP